MALSKDVVIRLLGDSTSAEKAMKAAADAAEVNVSQYKKAEREHARVTKAMETASRKQRAAMEDVGRGSMIAGATIVAGLGLAVKAAVNWESAWTGVMKTVNGSPAQLAKLESGLRGLSRVLPATHTEIAAVAEAAGQLGVKTDDILGFTKTMINLGETTNLSADEAATSLAQMMNVMRTAPKDVGRLGSTLVALGNAGASTEADIMSMAQRLAGAGQLIGASESDVLALASSMADMGIEAELGGGAMSRVMLKIYSAMQEGGDAAKGFADVAGMSAKDFAAKWKSDPVTAIDALVKGLGRVKGEGGNVVETLSDLGIEGTQNLQVMLALAGAGDQLTGSLATANKGWEQNTALIQEAAKRYDTTAAKTEMARNAINDAAISIGDTFLPVMASLAESVSDVATWFSKLPAPIQGAIGGLAGVAGVGALAGGAFLLLAPRVMETWKALELLRTSSPKTAAGLGAIGKAAGIVGVLFAVKSGVDGIVESLKDAPPTMEQTTQALLGMADGMGRVDSMFAGNKTDVFGDSIKGLADAARELTDPSMIDRLDDFGGEIASFGSADGRAERDHIVEQLGQMGDSLALMVQSGNADLAAQQFDLLAAEWKKGGGNLDDLRNLMPAYSDALKGVDNDQKTAAASAQTQAAQAATLAQNLDVAYGSLGSYAAALGLDEEATKKLIEASNALGESLGAFIDPLGTYTGLLQQKAQAEADAANATAEKTGAQSKSWEDFVGSVHVSFEEYMTALEEQVAAQEDWQTNMLLLAGRVSAGTLAELSRMGPEGAPLVADLVTRSDAELDKFDDITAKRSKEATDAWGAQLTMAAPVLAEIARKGGQGAADAAATALANGTKTLAQIASDWGVAIAGGVNPILQSLGKPTVRPPNNGRKVAALNADGNVYENHQAEIAPAGAWRVWAEPETGGEAYIPLSPAKRARSVGIWQETGRLLGQYANGGFANAGSVPKPPSTAPYRAPLSTVADAAMQKVYEAATAWVTANVAGPGGPVGTGATGGSWQALWARVHAQFPTARRTSDFRPGDPGYHGRGKAVDVAGARPGDAAAMLAINRWAAATFGGSLAELIHTPGINLWHGKPHTYNAATRAGHYDHVHMAAYAKGGILNPHIRDAGGPLLPGYTYNGLGRPEHVMPTMPVGSARSGSAGPVSVEVNIEGARIVGTLEVDGMEGRIDGRIANALTAVTNRQRY